MTNDRNFSDEISEYLAQNPGANQSKCADDLHMTWRTVKKNWPGSSMPTIVKPTISASVRTVVTTNNVNLLDEIRKIIREELAIALLSDDPADDQTTEIIDEKRSPDIEVVRLEKRILELLKNRPEGVNALKLSSALEMNDAEVIQILENMFNRGTLKIMKKCLEPYHTRYTIAEG